MAPRAEVERARWPLLIGVAAFVLAADQLSKWWAVETLDTRIIDVVGSLRFRLALNHGAAFSLSRGRGPIISVLALVVVVILLRTGRHATRPLAAVALGMVVGGALGNLSDRAFREGEGILGGGVVDFIDLQWWPIFNVADMGVVCGAILLVIMSWREPEPTDGAGDGGDAGSDTETTTGTGAGTGTGTDAGTESSPSRV